jgi:hypothetical protein
MGSDPRAGIARLRRVPEADGASRKRTSCSWRWWRRRPARSAFRNVRAVRRGSYAPVAASNQRAVCAVAARAHRSCLPTWAMTGLIWFVQVVHYPLFARSARRVRAYHAAFRLTTLVVGPLMLVEAVCGVWIAFERPPAAWSGVALLAAWGATFLVSVPRHTCSPPASMPRSSTTSSPQLDPHDRVGRARRTCGVVPRRSDPRVVARRPRPSARDSTFRAGAVSRAAGSWCSTTSCARPIRCSRARRPTPACSTSRPRRSRPAAAITRRSSCCC